MNWSAVKNLLIAILVAANAFLIFNIAKQDRTRVYIDADEVDGAIELLQERGLPVDDDTVPLEKFNAPVYESSYNDEYYAAVAETLSGSEREMLVSLPNGGFSVTANNGNIIEFDAEFGFSYWSNDNSDTSAYTGITASDFYALKNRGKTLQNARFKELSKLAVKFLDSRVSGDYVFNVRITDGFEDEASGRVYLFAEQELDGHYVYSHYAVCVFSGDKLVQANGRWYFTPFDEKYNTELIDQVNIMFSDLSVLRSDAVRDYSAENDVIGAAMIVPDAVAALSDVHTDTTAALEIGELPGITAIKSCYATYWNADKSAVYFIPAWQIDHDNGRIIVYNATNGTVYSDNR